MVGRLVKSTEFCVTYFCMSALTPGKIQRFRVCCIKVSNAHAHTNQTPHRVGKCEHVIAYCSKSEASVQQFSPCTPSVRQVSANCTLVQTAIDVCVFVCV